MNIYYIICVVAILLIVLILSANLPRVIILLVVALAAYYITTDHVHARPHRMRPIISYIGGAPPKCNDSRHGLYLGKNSCYMNATLQMLYAITPFRDMIYKYPESISMNALYTIILLENNISPKLHRKYIFAIDNVFRGLQNSKESSIEYNNDTHMYNYKPIPHHKPKYTPYNLRIGRTSKNWENKVDDNGMYTGTHCQTDAINFLQLILEETAPHSLDIFQFTRTPEHCAYKHNAYAETIMHAKVYPSASAEIMSVQKSADTLSWCTACANSFNRDPELYKCGKFDYGPGNNKYIYTSASEYILCNVIRDANNATCIIDNTITLNMADGPLRTYVFCGAVLHTGDSSGGHYRYIHKTDTGYRLYNDSNVTDMELDIGQDQVLKYGEILVYRVVGDTSNVREDHSNIYATNIDKYERMQKYKNIIKNFKPEDYREYNNSTPREYRRVLWNLYLRECNDIYNQILTQKHQTWRMRAGQLKNIEYPQHKTSTAKLCKKLEKYRGIACELGNTNDDDDSPNDADDSADFEYLSDATTGTQIDDYIDDDADAQYVMPADELAEQVSAYKQFEREKQIENNKQIERKKQIEDDSIFAKELQQTFDDEYTISMVKNNNNPTIDEQIANDSAIALALTQETAGGNSSNKLMVNDLCCGESTDVAE